MGPRSKTGAGLKLTDQQRERLKHVEAAERRGEALTGYAKRHRLSVSSLYEAKRRLRQTGVVGRADAATAPKDCSPRFVRLAVRKAPAGVPVEPTSLRVQLANGTSFEWGEAPRGDALRELIEIVS